MPWSGETSRRLFGDATAGRLAALAREASGSPSRIPSDPDSPDDPLATLGTLFVGPPLAREICRREENPTGLPSAEPTLPLRVLIVDDEEGVRIALAHMLAHHGCIVGEAGTAHEARDAMHRGWDMVLLDIMLPDANGLELIPSLRSVAPGVDVVMVTAFATLESSVEALRRGASDFLMKPFTMAEITRLIARGTQRTHMVGERQALLDRLERTVFELELLSRVGRATSTTLDPRDLVAIFVEGLPDVLRPDLVRAWARGREREVSWEVGRIGTSGHLVPAARAIEGDILAVLGQGGRVPCAAGGPPAITWIAVPLFAGDGLGGLVVLASSHPHRYSPEDARLLYRVAETLAFTVQRGRELVETEMRRMESVVGAMGEGVVVTDSRGVPIVVNPAARMLLSLPLEGDAAHLMEHSAVGFDVLSHLRAVLKRREVTTTRELLLEGDPPRRLSLQAGLVSEEGSEARGVVALLEDVTRRREFDILQSEFVSAVSHELRTPLSCVKNYIDMVLERRAGELTPNQDRFLATARRNVDRLTLMIDNLLSLSRSAEVRADASHEAVDLGALARTLVESVRADAVERELTFDLQLPVESLAVRGDGERLAQALGLLVRQAVRVSRRGSRIEILGGRATRASIRPPSDETEALANHARWVRLSVRLEHAEITPVEARDLFRRFRPSRHTGSRPLAASGLDLALARNLVEAHEGHLWAEVRDEGGLHLELILPVEGPSPRQGELLERVHTLLERSRREGLAMSVLLFRLGGRIAAEESGDRDELADVDAALRAVAGVLRYSLRQEDRLFANRSGGELVLLLERTDARGMTVVGERVADRLRALSASDPGPLAGFIAELGWSTFPQDGVTAQEIMGLARRRCVPVGGRQPSPSEGGSVSCLTQES